MQDHNNVETDGTVNHSVAAAVPHKNNPMPGYDQPYVTSRTATYQVLDDAMHPTERSGTLPEGKVVWAAPDILTGTPEERSTVMLEGTGMVRIETGALRLQTQNGF